MQLYLHYLTVVVVVDGVVGAVSVVDVMTMDNDQIYLYTCIMQNIIVVAGI